MQKSEIVHEGVDVPLRPKWSGHRIHEGHVTLEYELHGDDVTIVVLETPERVAAASGAVSLARIFQVDGLPAGDELQLVLLPPGEPTSSGLDGAGPGPSPVVDLSFPADGAQSVVQTWAAPDRSG